MNVFEKEDPRLHLEFLHQICAIMQWFLMKESKPNIDISRFGFSVVAIPKSVEKIPDYLLNMMDLQPMINNNINGYILIKVYMILKTQI